MSGKTYELDQLAPEGDWIGWKAHMDLAGSQHVTRSIADFVKALSFGDFRSKAAVEREPSNPYDKNALRVLALMGEQSWPVGYVPKSDASELARFSSSMPLAARLIRIRFIGDALYVRAHILLPSKKARIANGWEAR